MNAPPENPAAQTDAAAARTTRESRRERGRRILALVFVAAGILHFVVPVFYVRIVPPSLPSPRLLVYISGVCEVLGGLGVLIPGVRRAAGVGLILLLCAVYPANIFMFQAGLRERGMGVATGLLLLRLPLQFLLIWWVYDLTLKRPDPVQERHG